MDQVFDADGSAVIVHGGADNLANIPARYSSNAQGAPATGPDAQTTGTGDSGARVLCGFMSTELVNERVPNPKPTVGSVGGFGEAVPAGEAPAGAKPVVGIASAVSTDGYWLAAEDGGVFTGNAPFLGSMGGKTLNAPMVGIAGTPTGLGYLMAGADGGIFTFGDAKFEGSAGGLKLNKPVVGVATRSARAYAVLHDATGNTLGTLTLTGTDAAVVAAARAAGLSSGFHGFHFHGTGACTAPGFLDAGGHLADDGEHHGMHDGDMPALLANADGTAEAAFGTDNLTFGELFDADGSAAMIHAGSDNYANIPADRYSTGGNPGPDATTLATGDAGGRLACGVVQGVADANGGYWEVASDGGVFTFGNVPFAGSMGDKPLNAPIVGMAPTPSGRGYWLVGNDGGVFTFGDAGFFGSLGDKKLNAPIVGMTADPTGLGYWLVAQDGGVFSFGTARFFGSEGATPPPHGAAGIATSGGGHGYWVANT